MNAPFRAPLGPCALLEVATLDTPQGTSTVVCWMNPLSRWHIVELLDDHTALDTGPLGPRDHLEHAVSVAVDYCEQKRRYLAGHAPDPARGARRIEHYRLPPAALRHRLSPQTSLLDLCA